MLKQNEKALQIEKLLLQKHPHKHERFQIYLKRLQRLIELDQKEEAIETGLQALSLFDFKTPKTISGWEKAKQAWDTIYSKE